MPKLSPLPVVRTTPVSPRRRISSNHSVFINAFNSSSSSPLKAGSAIGTTGVVSNLTLSPKPYVFNRSPAKDLRLINDIVRRQPFGAKRLDPDVDGPPTKMRRMEGSAVGKNWQSVFGERQTSQSPPSASSGLPDENQEPSTGNHSAARKIVCVSSSVVNSLNPDTKS